MKRDNGPVEILRKAGIGQPEYAASHSISHIAAVKVRTYGLPDNHRQSPVCWTLAVNTSERLRRATLRTKVTNLTFTWRKEVQPKRQLQPTRPHKPQYSTVQRGQTSPHLPLYRNTSALPPCSCFASRNKWCPLFRQLCRTFAAVSLHVIWDAHISVCCSGKSCQKFCYKNGRFEWHYYK